MNMELGWLLFVMVSLNYDNKSLSSANTKSKTLNGRFYLQPELTNNPNAISLKPKF